MPSLERVLDIPGWAASVVAIERRALPLLGAALLAISRPAYGCSSSIPDTTDRAPSSAHRATLMLVKHVAVIGFVALAVLVDRATRNSRQRTTTRPDAERADGSRGSPRSRRGSGR